MHKNIMLHAPASMSKNYWAQIISDIKECPLDLLHLFVSLRDDTENIHALKHTLNDKYACLNISIKQACIIFYLITTIEIDDAKKIELLQVWLQSWCESMKSIPKPNEHIPRDLRLVCVTIGQWLSYSDNPTLLMDACKHNDLSYIPFVSYCAPSTSTLFWNTLQGVAPSLVEQLLVDIVEHAINTTDTTLLSHAMANVHVQPPHTVQAIVQRLVQAPNDVVQACFPNEMATSHPYLSTQLATYMFPERAPQQLKKYPHNAHGAFFPYALWKGLHQPMNMLWEDIITDEVSRYRLAGSFKSESILRLLNTKEHYTGLREALCNPNVLKQIATVLWAAQHTLNIDVLNDSYWKTWLDAYHQKADPLILIHGLIKMQFPHIELEQTLQHANIYKELRSTWSIQEWVQDYVHSITVQSSTELDIHI